MICFSFVILNSEFLIRAVGKQTTMKNSNQTTTGNNNLNLQVCEVCKQTGQHGAQWLVHIEGQAQAVKVHKPCGETLLEQAPEGVKGKVVPSRELRALWDRQRQEKSARSFWDEKFAQAKPISRPAPMVVATPPPAPVTVAQAA